MASTALQKEGEAVRRVPFMVNRAEALWWAYMRLSGMALILLVLGHFAIQHIINDVHNLSAEWVIEQRWALAGWRIYDALMLAIGYTHGLRGLWQVAQDYIHNKTVVLVIKWVLIIGGGLVLLIGAMALVGTPWRTSTP